MDNFLDKASKSATIIIGLVTLYFAWQTAQWDDVLKQIEADDRTAKLTYERLAFDREFKFKIYQLALEAVKSKDSAQQEAAYVAVNAMVTDTAFRSGLIGLFVKSVAPEIRKAATVASFDIRESREINPVYSSADKIHVAVIYLEGVTKSKVIATKIYNALKTSDSYEVSTQELKANRNNSIYQIERNQIRYDADEKAKAERLKEVVNQILPESAEPFVIQSLNGTPTKKYISLFVIQ